MNILNVCSEFIGGGYGIPGRYAMIIGIAYRVIEIVVPLILILWGMVDLLKSVMASKEDEIKKGRSMFMKRIISGCLIFFVAGIVKFAVDVISDENGSALSNCISSVISCTSETCSGASSGSLVE